MRGALCFALLAPRRTPYPGDPWLGTQGRLQPIPMFRYHSHGMATEYCLTAERLLAGIRASHEALLAHTAASAAERQALAALYQAFAAGVMGLSEEELLAAPAPEEWSMAEVLEHVAEHDRKFDEYHRLGLGHYVEHGLEHALQLWRLRPSTPPPGGDGARAGT